ncbi:ATP synthase F1 subunit gamma [Candidatus Mycosynbacter amalyticus]|uniref:ATP synthase gamma chain n=1 Tax=Candidatus Mycosynbacter amalyticus TaxID=2665156 RepID=A0A857MJH1_9BACT|nr:ATP synthase F1 subunit gamma [Candidatus Mycosynbacter amalyticus]QHN42724.1 ATP synthase F1 subunit gamma [Candidatus Mycosynbacter amalyticus]
MPSTRALKTRIRSVKSTKQITKAMQLVAASKMRKAQEAEAASAPYTRTANEILTHLANQGVTDRHPLYEVREIKSRLLIVVATDKGLAGAYDANVLKLYTRQLIEDDRSNVKNQTIAIGRRASRFVSKLKDTQVAAVYQDLADDPAGSQLRAIVDMAIEKFEAGDVDAVDVVFTEYISSVNQQAITQRILPAGYEAVEVGENVREAEFEPSQEEVLQAVTYRLIEAQVYHALLTARASEYIMRMMAMKNATDNATDLIDDLTLAMNKARQAAITQELAEISGGVEALNE